MKKYQRFSCLEKKINCIEQTVTFTKLQPYQIILFSAALSVIIYVILNEKAISNEGEEVFQKEWKEKKKWIKSFEENTTTT